jgi:UDP:flavonoid glycosyltransferase YjiC (YdhE family)
MKIVCISMAEMGHFIPIMHIAEELQSRGHDVTVLTNEVGKEKCVKMINSIGCKPLVTNDGLNRETLAPNVSEINPDGYTGQRKWKIFVKEELAKLKPDVAVIDFLTPAPFFACDELNIPVVLNMPFPLEMLKTHFRHNYPSRDTTSTCCGFICIR